MLGALRGDRRRAMRVATGLVLLVAATAVAGVGISSLADASAVALTAVLVSAGSAVTLGFFVAPLVTGANDPLDPRRFAVLGLAPRALAAVLVLAGLISVPSLIVVALTVCAALVWVEHGVNPAVAGVSAVAGVLTCVLAARVSLAIAALVLRERRSRELTGIFLVGVLVVVVPVGVFLASLEWRGTVPPQLSEVVDALAVTPLGAAWALPGATGAAAIWTAVAAVSTLVALGFAWVALVNRALTTTERPVAVHERGGLGWFAVAPGTPSGVIAARSLVYWFRDRRYLVNIVVVPIAAALTVVPLVVAGVPLELVVLVPVPVMALFFGWLPHNDLAYDSTAVWMHLASGVRGAADRVGRLVPMLLVGVPILAIAIPVVIALHGRWAVLPAMVGVCAALFLSGLGLSSITSALAPYAVTRPGDSPFQQPQRAGSGAFAQGLVLLGSIAAAAPALWWGSLALTRDLSYAFASMWAGIGAGSVVLVLGIAIGSAVFHRRGSRLMEFAESA